MKTDNPIRSRARKIIRRLAKEYPDAKCALHHEDPLQLLIATILSAQCTDVRVNMVTPDLFARFPDAKSYATADPRALEKAIQSTGFFRNKTRNIIACCKQIVEEHSGQVPRTMEELVRLPGGRLSRRLGLTRESAPEKVERDLMNILPAKDWTMFSHGMIFHGRQICHARKPRCSKCVLAKVCPRIGVTESA